MMLHTANAMMITIIETPNKGTDITMQPGDYREHREETIHSKE